MILSLLNTGEKTIEQLMKAGLTKARIRIQTLPLIQLGFVTTVTDPKGWQNVKFKITEKGKRQLLWSISKR